MSEFVSKNNQADAHGSDLGKKTSYSSDYNPLLLYSIPRLEKREEIGIRSTSKLPFFGYDLWNHYEVSWLNGKGKPIVAIAEIVYDCHSTNIIESKSLKLYFNSLNNTQFNTTQELERIIAKDLKAQVGSEVSVRIFSLADRIDCDLQKNFMGESLDALDVECSVYLVDPSFLRVGENIVEEVLTSDLLKSNCLVTHQPDWGSIQISYRGKKIDREGLLKYLVSFRNHNEFHEQCIERIFMDIMTYCQPDILTIYGRYTRRGGLDINPYRTTERSISERTNTRLIRQ